VFEQYLTTTMIPTLEYRLTGDTIDYRWTNVVPGFDMPVKATLDGRGCAWLRPTTSWKRTRVSLPDASNFRLDPNFYVTARAVAR
jgi:hypothetical protein